MAGIFYNNLPKNSFPERRSVFRWETGVVIFEFGAYNYKYCDAEIYHKDDESAHSSRNPTGPGLSELLGTSLGMPLIVLDKY